MAQTREVAVFIFNGLLESGKTVMINRFLDNPQICDGKKKILLVLCEEGIEEYDEKKLNAKNAQLLNLEDEADYNAEYFAKLEKDYKPDLVVVEYNGVWRGTLPLEIQYPNGWQIAEVMTTVDSSTFDAYAKNLRAMMIEQYKITDIVVFNRFKDDEKKFSYRSLVKAANMGAQVVFEYENGQIDTAFDASPFDLTKDEIDVGDGDFGVFYFDVMDNAGKYDGKIVNIRAMTVKINAVRMPGFLVGRFAMTCCANDIQFLSIYAQNNMKFKNKAWYNVRAKVVLVDASTYGEASGELLPAFEVLGLTPAEKPEDEIVTF
ncbi:MAG: hypothetical protein MJ175_00600 [Clostridia bacterium]|nr:hypothetical protein [Clostridia bacterium]